jgi:hypothetical protein
MRPEEFGERLITVDGWPVRLTTYRLGETYYCKADNVEPGADLARGSGVSQEEVEKLVLDRARRLLGRTRRSSGDAR